MISQQKSIGGYLALEKNKTEFSVLNQGGIALNTARNCLEYILLNYQFSKIYIPYFTCDVILEPLQRTDTIFCFYNINEHLEPVFDFNLLKDGEAFLYTNYFGIKGSYIASLVNINIAGKLILDNAQALFAKHIEGTNSFNSVRKFIGVADGAFVYTENNERYASLAFDESYNRMGHLLKRIDRGAEEAYKDFIDNDKSLSGMPVMRMSVLTHQILEGIDVEEIKGKRKVNFDFLHKYLHDENLLHLTINEDDVPLVYPFRTKDASLRARLIQNKIYCAQYWPNVLEWCTEDQMEYQLTNEIIAIPIDQRYTVEDMSHILKIIKNV